MAGVPVYVVSNLRADLKRCREERDQALRDQQAAEARERILLDQRESC